MRIVVISIMIVLNFIFESTIFQYTRIMSVKPDFALILIVSYAIIRGSIYGGYIGLAAGLLNDIAYGQTLGVNALSYLVTGYIIGQSQENVFKDSFIPPLLFNIAGVFLYQNIFYLISYLTKTNISYTYGVLNIMIPQSIYNGILGTFLYRYIFKLDEKRFMKKRIF